MRTQVGILFHTHLFGRNKYLKLIFTIVTILLVCIDSFSQTRSRYLFSCNPKMEEPYGICTHINSKEKTGDWYQRTDIFTRINEIGINFMRTDLYWFELQPRLYETLRFQQYDDFIRPMFKRNIEFLPIFTYQESSDNNALTHTKEWIEYILACIRRYPKIKYVEIINEADRIQNLNGSEYCELLRKAYKAIKDYNKDIKVLYSSYSKADSDFFDDVMKSGGNTFFDIMNYHYYNWNSPPETAIKQIVNFKRRLDTYQIKKHIWVTETGYPTTLVTDSNQAKYLPRVFILGFSYGFDKIFWYDLKSTELVENDNESNFGIYHKNLVPKPAVSSYKTLIRMCPSGSTRPEVIKDGDLYIAHWRNTSRKHIYAVWSSKQSCDISISRPYRRITLYDGRAIQGESELNVGNCLVYIQGQKEEIKINNKIYKF